MAEFVTNPTRNPKEVVIITADGKRDSVFVQPSGKVALPPGARVENSFKERNKDIRVKTV